MFSTLDPALARDWFTVADSASLKQGDRRSIRLLGEDLVLARDHAGRATCYSAFDNALQGHVKEHCGCIWICLGETPRDIFALPEFAESERRYIYMGGFGIHSGGLRVVENFLDMAHFPFVHANILGAVPHTEVRDYDVEVDTSSELWARNCRFIQPKASAASTAAADIGYIYRVVNPFTTMLYKYYEDSPEKKDVIFLSVQPIEEDECIAHFSISLFDNENTDSDITHFQQIILAQDKPILENHSPKRLPLDPSFEVPIRADASSTAYRKWLRSIGLRYGVEPSTEESRPLRRLLTVARKWKAADDVVALELRDPVGSALTAAPAGAHIDVELPSGLVRQYSICNPDTSRESYLIAVKKEPKSKGGSLAIHDLIDVGSSLRASAPRNHFPISSMASRHILVAGGIGVTPLLAMARHLTTLNANYELHVFARDEGHVPFASEIRKELHGRAYIYTGLDAEKTTHKLQAIVDSPKPDDHVYCCGPAPFMAAAVDTARQIGWAEDAIHVEHFVSPGHVSRSGHPFIVRLARSGRETTVTDGQSVLEALRVLGVKLDANCEQGVCGTCQCRLLEGDADHRDFYLSAKDRAAGLFMPCVSRAAGKRISLDL